MLFSIVRQFGSVSLVFLLLLSLCHSLSAAHITVQISIDGVKGELLKNVLAYLSLEQQKTHPRLSVKRIQRLHKQAPKEIQRALQPFGYYQVNITSELKRPQNGQIAWQAHYLINLGEPLKIKEVDIRINGDAKDDSVFQKQIENFPVKNGETLNHPNYEKGKRLLRNLAEERGYFESKFTRNEIHFDEQAYTARILLSFDTGQRYRFGEVSFKKNFFNKSLLERFLTFEKGSFYTGNALLAFKNALTYSDYFDVVEVEMMRSSVTDDLFIPVEVTLERRKPNKYMAGIGYGTDTGVRGSLEWKRRYINPYGHRFSAKAELSEIRRSMTARYEIPTKKRSKSLSNIDNFFAITAGYKDEHTDTSESEILLLGVSQHHSRRILSNIPLSEVIGIEYRDEKYTIGSDSGHAKMLMPHINWSYVKADNRIYTLRGHKIELGVQGALSNVGSNVSFLQTRLNTTLIRKVLDSGRIIARGNLGYSSISLLDGEFHDLPPSIRFFAGGDRSVRGYDYQTLGPKNLEGQVIGGKNLLVGSLEYEHKILEKWSLAIFYDVGNAFNDFSETLKQGTGLGVRWQSPVGLVRVDVATALSEENYPLRLHITVGPDL
ncbi:autotransporter assembly complex family protein [Candidatus Parabeggiatoa sp. HSG14]|uniref:autotransporter assembly complex protein TamA n=1 Tax=Candidatus Parabeggiatoa sp. HSG14 TaxID=3055593 RepID=UPI0025A6B908|nr:autotransporter assembly complex family protein [Thiotrichales bacterium HSG14]